MLKKYNHILFYIVVIGSFLGLMYWIVQTGKPLEVGKVTVLPTTAASHDILGMFRDAITQSINHPLAILLLQIIAIIITARTFGFLFNKIGQPTVIGEVIAGIFLGPSLMGMWFPEYTAFLFPKTSLPTLQYFSQIGLILFMFVVGMELDLKVLKTKARDAVIISHASIIVPYALGMGLAYFIYEEFAPANINFLSFSLFMGIAMSITAFPVLARILQERGMTKSKLGTIAITCAAADDITAWCILASVIAIVKAGSFTSSVFTIAMALVYVFIMLKVIQPFLKKVGEVYSNKETVSLNIIAIIFGVLLISAYTTEVIGIHALFGAFLAGVIMPPSFSFRKILTDKVEYVALGLLLPLFFAFSGLRTQIGLLNDSHTWMICGAIILIAVVGKFGGSMFAARFVGQSWRDSLAIGALMNTRGLVELIVLNIGYDLGVLTPTVFTMMVLMALITTFMTGPALDLINRFSKEPATDKGKILKQKFKILISFGNPQAGKKMIRIANILSASASTQITALHITPSADTNKFDANEYEKESFKPIRSEANKLGIDIKTVYKASNDVSDEILNSANAGDFNLLIVGAGQSVFQGSFLGKLIGITAKALNPEKLINTIAGKESLLESQTVIDEKIKGFISQSKIPVAIFIDKDFSMPEKIIIPIFSIGDIFLLFYAKRIIKNSNCQLLLIDYNEIINSNSEIKEEITNIENFAPNTVSLSNKKELVFNSLPETSLLISSFEGWKMLEQEQNSGAISSSVLLIRP
ncbi:MAG: Na+/H+-exchanging protein [Bacteroidetes bacterium]|nr:Na+/H+-exchanging protein [Bacteroidota bacterium]